MNINRNKSQVFNTMKIRQRDLKYAIKKGVVYTMIGAALLTIPKEFKAEATSNENSLPSMPISEFDKERYSHLQQLEDMYTQNTDEYNEEFLSFLKKGNIQITNKDNKTFALNLYKVFLITINIDNQEFTYLRDATQGDKNIFTDEVYSNAQTINIADFKYSTLFYEIFLEHQDEMINNTIILDYDESMQLCEAIKNWNGEFHNETPETRLINETRKRVK